MFTEKRKVSQQELSRISIIVNIVIVVIFVALFFLFWNIQVLKKEYYTRLATRNIEKQIEIKAPRGLILDRNHRRLSENKINFNLFLIREYTRDINKTIKAAVKFTGMTREEVDKTIKKYRGFPRSFAIPLKKDLPLKRVIYIESRNDEFPEFEVKIEPARAYPLELSASHILGYISELTGAELKRKEKDGYRLGDITGRSGIEKRYEKYLRGVSGVKTVIKDNLGKIQEVVSEVKPIIGHSVVLTIDLELQRYVEKIFAKEKGTIAVADLKTGGITAMVSRPNFDPDIFSGALERKEWLELINNPDKPLHNKFLQGLYLPGSTFKIVMALAGLQENMIDESTTSQCFGRINIYKRYFHCWNRGGHGNMNLSGALRKSCNVYFYRLGKKMDIDVISRYAGWLGLGKYTGIDMPNEKKGLFPTKAWKQKALKQQWYPGETVSVAIGGGMMNVTPAQVLTMISTVALRGKVPKLHLLKQVEKDGKVVMAYKPEFKETPIKREHFETVIEGLYRVVNDEGTARSCKIEGLDICGKTGTQLILSLENPNYKQLVKQKRFQPHSWFASFAPRNNPEYAVVVFVENGGDAGAIAAPLAKKVYNKIFHDKEVK